MKVSNNFVLQEFVTPEIWASHKERSLIFIDIRVIQIAQFLRDIYGGITINNWHTGGQYSESGLRSFNTSTGAKHSQHKYGRAIDLKFSDTTNKKVYADILANAKKFYDAGIRVVEDIADTPSWLHIDVRNTGKVNEIIIVSP